ncbi:hypothetical protein DSM25558_4335 [Agrobacterium sp. DSM 25558]|uniref:hypothetical protein n=1 Tax=Agrobacterium sp. DSM 25558 TaxID=1907665 RepID=UPI00097259C7|nr:hypothetical protein [Agrobacterium sp. DSM 25558]SCX27936.1 hypothetical protein DSM25558_4335 [Agrobacterium sp. DSM 25558]
MSAARSTIWTITNATDSDWSLSSSTLNHGVWASNPPQTIKAGATASFTAESNGVATGDEGTVVYSFSGGSASFYFDNPFFGSDDYTVAVPPGYDQNSNQQTGNTQVLTTRVFKTS